MNITLRKYCVLNNVSELEHLYTFSNFPIKMGCTNQPIEKDKFADMVWGYSDNGIVQLTRLLPLNELYDTSHSPGTIGKVWENHHLKFSNFIRSDIENNKVLEIGGASGILVDHFTKENIEFKWDIVEPSNQHFNDRRINHYKLLFEEFKNYDQYDIVVHSHLFEHVYHPINFLKKVNKLLKVGGLQFISLPNMHYWLENGYSNSLNFEHTFYYNFAILKQFFDNAGFEILEYVEGQHSLFFKLKKIKNTISEKQNSNLKNHNSKSIFLNYIKDLQSSVELINNKGKEFNKVFLFGAHIFSQTLINLGIKNELIEGILDNDPTKHGKRLYGTEKKVFSPTILKNLNKTLVVVKAGIYSNEINQQLETLNPNLVIIN